jgi:phage-related protein
MFNKTFEVEMFKPVVKFFKSLEKSKYAELMHLVELLKKHGYNISKEYPKAFHRLKGANNRELLQIQYDDLRILFFWVKNKAILLHGFYKKSNSTKATDIKVAVERMKDYLNSI